MRMFNAEQLTSALGDCLQSSIPSDVIVCNISTDTRTISEGDMFVALSGERFDGHHYIDMAIQHGAAVVMVEHEQTLDIPQILVSNTRLALAKLATFIRKEFVSQGGKVVGLTGSVGKTTNKQMLASILSQQGKTHATKGNLNNDLGVPFTWFDLPTDACFAVIEMGANHQGEIDYLSKITQPQVAMITNAGEAHLEGFGGLNGVAKGKGELFSNLRAGDTAVINADDTYADYWRNLITDGVAIKTFSLKDANADVFASNVADDGSQFTLNTSYESITVKLPTLGMHNVINALGCACCALALGVAPTQIATGLAQFTNAKGRLQTTQIGNLTIIDDSYNANPMSMRASADILSSQNSYNIMVVGDMAELGTDSRNLHAELGKTLTDKADHFLCLGNFMQAFAEQNDKAEHFSDIELLNSKLLNIIQTKNNVTILVKGSRSMAMERVIHFIQQQLNGHNQIG